MKFPLYFLLPSRKLPLSITDEDRERSLVSAISPRQRRSRRNLMLSGSLFANSIARRMNLNVFKFDVCSVGTKRCHCFLVDTVLHRKGLASELTKKKKKRIS